MSHYLDIADLPINAFKKHLFSNRPATLEGKGGGSSPQAPDPWETAMAQTQWGKEAASYNKALNAANISNPFGQQTQQQVGTDPKTGAPIYATNTTASGASQGLINSLMQNALGGSQMGQNVMQSLYGLGNQAAGNQLGSEAQDAYYRQATRYLDPQYSQQEESLKASLANQGLTPGSQAYNNAMTSFGNQRQQAYGQASDQAITSGQQLGLNKLAAASDTLARAGQMGNNPFQQLGSFASLLPGYQGMGQQNIATPDIGGLINNQYQAQLAQSNAQNQQRAQTMGTLGTLGAMGAVALGF